MMKNQAPPGIISEQAAPTYPNVRCEAHGPDRPGFVVCRGVFLGGREIAEVVAAAADHLGQMVCDEQGECQHTCPDTAIIVCPDCALQLWHRKLLELATAKGVPWMICPDPKTHAGAFENELTPAEELAEQMDAARDN